MFFLGLVLALVVYYYLARFALKMVSKFYPGKLAKYVAIAVFVLIPTWDIIPGQLYFSYLCRTQAGTKVFKTVEVDKTYFLKSGQPDEERLRDQYEGIIKVDRQFSRLFHIAKIQSSVRDKRSNEVLGTATDLANYGGWINANLFPQGPPDTCPKSPNHSLHAIIWREVIKPKTDFPAGGK
jgi:hypothetical protein